MTAGFLLVHYARTATHYCDTLTLACAAPSVIGSVFLRRVTMTDPNKPPPPRNPRIRPPRGRHRSNDTGCLSGIVRIPAIAIKVAIACLANRS